MTYVKTALALTGFTQMFSRGIFSTNPAKQRHSSFHKTKKLIFNVKQNSYSLPTNFVNSIKFLGVYTDDYLDSKHMKLSHVFISTKFNVDSENTMENKKK